MTEPQFCLKWNNFHTNLSDVFHNMLLNESMVDVTIACEGASLKAHKMILAACSPFFQSLFISNPCKHPIVILKDIRFVDLKATIDFMYKGEINVTQSQLGSVLKAAETLKIKGLTDVVQRHRDQNPIENEPDNIITPDNRDTHLHDSSPHHDVPMVTVTETANISQLMLEPLTSNQLPGVKRRSIMQRTSAFARVQRYRDETFYEINNVLHCKACGEILNHKKLSVIKHHIESQKHELNKKRMSSSSQT